MADGGVQEVADRPLSDNPADSGQGIVRAHPVLSLLVTLIVGVLGGGGVATEIVEGQSNRDIERIRAASAEGLEELRSRSEQRITELEENLDLDRQRTEACANAGSAAGELVVAISAVKGAMELDGDGDQERPVHVDRKAWNSAVRDFESARKDFSNALSTFRSRGLTPSIDDDPTKVVAEIDQLLRGLPQTLDFDQWSALKDREQHVADWSQLLAAQCAKI